MKKQQTARKNPQKGCPIKESMAMELIDPPLVQEDWDFASCPDDELYACAFYEYARSSDYWRRVVHAIRPIAEDTVLHAKLRAFLSPPSQAENLLFRLISAYHSFFRLFPEFPAIPWLNIPGVERNRRLVKFTEGIVLPPAIAVIPTDLAKILIATTPLEVAKFYERLVPASVASFFVCWDAPDGQILEDFEKWLIATRPESERRKEGGKRATQPDVLRTKLHDLGAMRMMKLMSVSDARKLNSTVGVERSWRRAKKDAKALLEDFNQDGFPVQDARGPRGAVSFLLGVSSSPLSGPLRLLRRDILPSMGWGKIASHFPNVTFEDTIRSMVSTPPDFRS